MALFKTTSDLRDFYPARMTFDFADLLPKLREVEQEFLAEQLLGQAMYETLEADYQADTLSAEQEAILERARVAVANMAVYRYTGVGNVDFTSGGLTVGGSSEHQKPAAEWRTRDLERTTLRSAYRGLDVLVNYLIEHVDDYPEWETSELYAALTARFVRTTAQFDGIIRIGNQGYLFRQMLPAIKRAEEGAVLDTLCSKTYRDALLAAITADTLTTAQAEVVHLVRLATVHLAMGDSITQLALGLSESGVWTYSSLVGGQTSEGAMAANEERLRERADRETKRGNAYLDKLRETLQAQAEADNTHPYRTTTCYVDPNAETPARFNTDNPVGGFM